MGRASARQNVASGIVSDGRPPGPCGVGTSFNTPRGFFLSRPIQRFKLPRGARHLTRREERRGRRRVRVLSGIGCRHVVVNRLASTIGTSAQTLPLNPRARPRRQARRAAGASRPGARLWHWFPSSCSVARCDSSEMTVRDRRRGFRLQRPRSPRAPARRPRRGNARALLQRLDAQQRQAGRAMSSEAVDRVSPLAIASASVRSRAPSSGATHQRVTSVGCAAVARARRLSCLVTR